MTEPIPHLHEPVLLQNLTEREREVVQCVAMGMSEREIACALHIAELTVANHLRHIYDRLGLHKRTSVAVYALTGYLPRSAIRPVKRRKIGRPCEWDELEDIAS